MELGQIRLSADVGGTFTDVAAFDETTGELRLGKTLTTPARLVAGIENGVAKAGAAISCGAPVPARHDDRDQHHSRAHRRDLCAADHPGLSRHLRDRPHQPAGILQSVLSAGTSRLIERDLRFEISERMRRAGQGADQARRGRGAGGGRRRGRRTASRRSPSCSCIPTAIPRTSCAPRRSSRRSYPRSFRHGLARTVAGISRVRADLDRGGQRLCRAARARATSARSATHLERGRVRRHISDRAVDRRPVRRRRGAERVHPDAGIRARRRA